MRPLPKFLSDLRFSKIEFWNSHRVQDCQKGEREERKKEREERKNVIQYPRTEIFLSSAFYFMEFSLCVIYSILKFYEVREIVWNIRVSPRNVGHVATFSFFSFSFFLLHVFVLNFGRFFSFFVSETTHENLAHPLMR